MENKDEKMCELRNDIDYYKNEVNRYKKEVEINERILKEKEEEYEEYNKLED
jgi:flagellar biosynthesis chaperone FliJ